MNMIIGASMRAMMAAIQSSGPVLVAVICFGAGGGVAATTEAGFGAGADTVIGAGGGVGFGVSITGGTCPDLYVTHS